MSGWLYIFRENGNDRMVKVGRRKGDEKDIRERFRRAMNCTIRGLSVVALWRLPNDEHIHAESKSHQQLRKFAFAPGARGREWFCISPDEAIRVCESVIGSPPSHVANDLPFDSMSLRDYDFFRQKKSKGLLRIWIHEEQRGDELPSAVKISCNGWWPENWKHKTYSPWPLSPYGCWTPTHKPVDFEATQKLNTQTRELHSHIAQKFGDPERHNKVVGWTYAPGDVIQTEIEEAGYEAVPLLKNQPPQGFDYSM